MGAERLTRTEDYASHGPIHRSGRNDKGRGECTRPTLGIGVGCRRTKCRIANRFVEGNVALSTSGGKLTRVDDSKT
jgi:hypothetical protein